MLRGLFRRPSDDLVHPGGSLGIVLVVGSALLHLKTECSRLHAWSLHVSIREIPEPLQGGLRRWREAGVVQNLRKLLSSMTKSDLAN